LKARAKHKQDVDVATKQVDAKGTVLIDVLVGSDGRVSCTKAIVGHPILTEPIQDALQHWTFAVANSNGKRVGYTGQILFTLCNISCGDAGPYMTIVK
jgi:hypothetical protein